MVMNLEMFKRCINEIKEHHKWQEKFGDFLEENVCQGSWCLVEAGGKLTKLAIDILQEEFDDKKNDLIGWWLYEDVDHKLYYNNGTIRDLNKVEDLYNYLVERYNDNHKGDK